MLRRGAFLCAGLALTTGCALLPMSRFNPADDATASSGVNEAASPLESEPTSPGGEPGAGDPGAGDPEAPLPQAIPDPLRSIVHSAGSRVAIRGAAIAFLGLERSGDQLRARFDLQSGSVTGARLVTPSGAVIDLHASGGDLLSELFGSAAAPPAKTAHLGLMVGDRIYLFEAGPAS